MSERTVIICDGCGRILERTKDIYKLNLKTDRYWDGADMDYDSIELHFCPVCAREIKDALKRIAEKLDNR